MPQNANKKTTITDIARHLQIHPSTVSRALNPNQSHRITPALVRKVSRLAKELGYQPNTIASALKKGKSDFIGIIIPDLQNPVFPSIIRGAQDFLENTGITALIASADNNKNYERKAIEQMRSRLVDGLIIGTARRQDPIVEECLNSQIPLVLINRITENLEVNAVLNDDHLGIRDALDHLIHLGHKNIVHIAGPQDTSTGHDRYLAFLNSLNSFNIEAPNKLIAFAEKFTADEGYRTLTQIIHSGAPFTAVVAANDELALGCLDALTNAGLTCPDDISVIGYNDMIMLDRISPPLTTVQIQHYEIGEIAAKTLTEAISNRSIPTKKIILHPKLIIRGSTKRLF